MSERRDSTESALYLRLADDIRSSIERGELSSGEKLDSERTYMERFDLSRGTVRQALAVLKAEGLIQSSPGARAVVLPTPPVSCIVSVVAIVVHERRTLAVRDAEAGTWKPPGRPLRLDEDPVDAVSRHVRTETGLEVAVGALIALYKDRQQGDIELVFRCALAGRPTEPFIGLDHVRWLDVAQISHHFDPIDESQYNAAAGERSGTTLVQTHNGRGSLDVAGSEGGSPPSRARFDGHSGER